MDDIDYFKSTYGFQDRDIILIPYGSRVYSTHKLDSDYDYLAVILGKWKGDTGEEYRRGAINIHMFSKDDFQQQLNLHKIHTLESYYLPEGYLRDFDFSLDLIKLRHEISAKSSHSFVKAKKKIEVEKDYYVGWKSLFHSLRILNFGIQIATKGKIEDYSAANNYWFDIQSAQQYNWNYFKEKYQPIYNNLATDFRKVAPKE